METQLVASLLPRFGPSGSSKQASKKTGRLNLIFTVYQGLMDHALKTGNFEEAVEHLRQISKLEAEVRAHAGFGYQEQMKLRRGLGSASSGNNLS